MGREMPVVKPPHWWFRRGNTQSLPSAVAGRQRLCLRGLRSVDQVGRAPGLNAYRAPWTAEFVQVPPGTGAELPQPS